MPATALPIPVTAFSNNPSLDRRIFTSIESEKDVVNNV